MRKLLVLQSIILITIVFSSCLSTSIYDTYRFLGKKEDSVLKAFYNDFQHCFTAKYSPSDLGLDDDFCDYIVDYTNLRSEYTFTKTNVTTYKSTNKGIIYNQSIQVYPDGCCFYGVGNKHNYTNLDGSISHNRGQSYNQLSNRFYSFINSHDSYKLNQDSYAFNIHRIGQTYYLYDVSERHTYGPVSLDLDNGRAFSDDCDIRHLIITQVDVVAKETYNTEEHELFYIEDLNKFFDEKSEITKHEFDSAQEYYLSQGFSKSQKFAGANKLSFIKDGKIIAIGHWENNEEYVFDCISERK